MPKAVLGGIVFLIGYGLIDILGLKAIKQRAPIEFWVALVTAVVVCAVGVEQGIVLAIVLSIIALVQRQYRPSDFVVGVDDSGEPTYQTATPGLQSLPGLIIFRYDAELFYANANRFADDVQGLVEAAPERVNWLVLDCSSIVDVDYSAGTALDNLVGYLHAKGSHFAVAAADSKLLAQMQLLGVLDKFGRDKAFPDLDAAIAAYRADPSPYSAPAAAAGAE
jgi:MFS superfamily sulfate permease-like transporter